MKAVRPTAFHIHRLYVSTVCEMHPSFNHKHISTIQTLRDLNSNYVPVGPTQVEFCANRNCVLIWSNTKESRGNPNSNSGENDLPQHHEPAACVINFIMRVLKKGNTNRRIQCVRFLNMGLRAGTVQGRSDKSDRPCAKESG